MHHLPENGQKVFEAHIYNQEVREQLKENQIHCFYNELWADLQVHDVIAKNASDARRQFAKRFPPEKGFVVEDVLLIET